MYAVIRPARLAAFVLVCSAAVADEPQAKTPPVTPGIRSLVFSPDGKRLAGATGEPDQKGEVIVWSVPAGAVQFYYQAPEGIPAVAYSPNEKTLAIGGFTRVARLLHADSGEVLREFRGHDNFVRCVAFAGPDMLVTGSYDKTLKIWDVRSGDVRATLRGHEQRIQSVVVSADGKRAATASMDNTARLWDLSAGKELGVLLQADIYITCLAHDGPSGAFLTGCWDGWVRSHESADERLRGSVRCQVSLMQSFSLSTDGRTLAVGSNSTHVFLFETDLQPADEETSGRIKTLLTTLDDDDFATRERAERELAAIGLPAAALLRTAYLETRSAEVRIRVRRIREQIRTAEPFATLPGHSGLVQHVCFSPDGKLLASGDDQGEVRLWDVSRPRDGVHQIATFRRPQAEQGKQ